MKKSMLIVDDLELNRTILRVMFEDDYEIVEAKNGEEAISAIKERFTPFSIILLDIVMPALDGFGVLSYLSEDDLMEHTPVILITGDDSDSTKKKAYSLGVSDIIQKPFDSYIVKTRVTNVVNLYLHKNDLSRMVNEQVRKIKSQSKRIKDMNNNIIDILGTVVEFRDLESGDHIKRVKEFTKIIATCVAKKHPEYNITENDIDNFYFTAAMHDIGKIAIPDNILLKPGKLDKEEWEIMKTHAERGSDLIMHMKNILEENALKCSYEIAKYHHEKYDGNGYPEGLKGDEIPISAQIVSIADVYDALTNERVYKRAFSFEKAYNMIMNGECGAFNPKILDCFTICLNSLKMYNSQCKDK